MVQVFWGMFYTLIGAIGVGVVTFVVLRLIIHFSFRRAHARELHREGKRCMCGYELVGLEVPRCPECGRAIGFDKTFEELGITPEEIKPRPKPSPEPSAKRCPE